MAGVSDEEWDKLQDFDTYRLIDAVDEVDALRGMVADDGIRPPEIRNRLFKLHQLAMAVINEDAQEDAGELFELAQELDDEVAGRAGGGAAAARHPERADRTAAQESG